MGRILSALLFASFFFFLACRNDKVSPDKTAEIIPDSLARQAVGSGNISGYDIAVDANGNMYVIGSFTGPSAIFDTITLSSFGDENGFIAKYNPQGKVLWVKNIAEAYQSWTNSIVLDKEGNLYVSGATRELNTDKSAFSFFVLLRKYSSDGDLIWQQSPRSIGSGFAGGSIAMDELGNLYMFGGVYKELSIGNTVIDGGEHGVYLAKFNNLGGFQWVKVIRSDYSIGAYGIAANADGNIYITGRIEGKTNFENNVLSPSYGSIMYTAKYDKSGKLIWVRNTGEEEKGYGNLFNLTAVSLDTKENIYFTGNMVGRVRFGNINMSASNGSTTVYLAKLDSDGNFLWIRDLGFTSSNSINIGSDIATNTNGDIYVSADKANGPYSNLFVAKYNESGNNLWKKTDGQLHNTTTQAISVSNSGHLYLTGYFTGNTVLAGDTLGGYVNSPNSNNMFLVKYKEPK